MNGRWFNPLEETPEGLLLKDVASLLKEVKNKKKADLDKDGKLSGYEKKRAKAIESSMAKDGYKSDRGQKKAPKMPNAKGNKNVIKFDASDDCPRCGANPHEECGLGGASHDMHRAIDCLHNPVAFDSRFDDMREGVTPGEVMDLLRSDEKNTNCSMCNSMCNDDGSCDNCGTKAKKIEKYSVESSVENLFPQFQNVDGGMPVNAHGFTTNGTYPATNDGPKKSIVSETAKIPAYAKNGYTAKSSSLHMNYNNAGGSRSNPPNIDTIEQRLASLTKQAGRHNMGVIGEIEGLLKQVKDHLAKDEDYCARCQIAERLGSMGGGSSPSMHRGKEPCPPHCKNYKKDD